MEKKITWVLAVLLFCPSAQALEIERFASWKNQAPDWTCKVELADVDNDGYPDLVTANYLRTGKTENTADIKIYRNTGGVLNSRAGQVLAVPANVGSWNIALGDYDNDGDLDLAAGNLFYVKDLLFRNNQGTFDPVPVWESRDASVSHGLEWVDFDQDGDLDLCVSAAYSGVKIYENDNGSINPQAVWESEPPLDYQDVAWADMDNDTDPDLAVANHNAVPPGGIFIYKTGGNGQPPAWNWFSSAVITPGRLAWGDLDADGLPELATTNANGPAAVFGNLAGRLQQPPAWQSADTESSFDLLFADADNDGLVDETLQLTGPQIKKTLTLPHAPAHAVRGVRVNDAALSAKQYCFNLKDGWVALDAAALQGAAQVSIDYTYSTDLDLVVAKSTWEGNPGQGKADRIYLNDNGTLSAQAGWQTGMKTLSTAVAAGDVDNDGDLDFVFGGEVGNHYNVITRVPQHTRLYYNRTINAKKPYLMMNVK